MTVGYFRSSTCILVTISLILACEIFLGGANAQFGFPGAFPPAYMSGPSPFVRPPMLSAPPFPPVRGPALFPTLSNDHLNIMRPTNWLRTPTLRTPYTYDQSPYGYYSAPKPPSPARQCRSSGACKEIDHGTTLATTWKMETTTVPTTVPTTLRPITTTLTPTGPLRTSPAIEQPSRNPTTWVRFYASDRSDNINATMSNPSIANVTSNSVSMTPRR